MTESSLETIQNEVVPANTDPIGKALSQLWQKADNTPFYATKPENCNVKTKISASNITMSCNLLPANENKKTHEKVKSIFR